MSLEEGLLLFLAILGIYFLLVIILHKKGVLEKYNISLWGPALMWRTERGKKLIGRIAKHKWLWVRYANAGIVVCFILMIMMLVLLLFTLPLALEQEENIISSNPQLIIGLPGLNPIIPLWYGILGFIVALVVHEFSHGILASAQKLKVKSLGLLYFIIPIGAFCEPVEEELKKTSIKKRMRVFAAGPMANIVTAFICVALISLLLFTAVQPAADGVGVYSTVDDMPADELGLKTGMVITSINNSSVVDVSSFKQVMENTGANQTVEISFVYGKQQFTEQITLADKYQVAYQALLEQYDEVNTSLIADFEGKGYLGASVTTQFKQDLLFLQNPFLEFPFGFLYYMGLPIFGLLDGYSSLNAPFSDYYVVNSFIPEHVFWVMINALYWVFWFNFMVATFNVLPMVPLDGGYIFRDFIGSLLKKLKRNLSDEAREKIVGRLSTAISLFILLLVLAPILIPHIKGLF
jgi:membrane-associated protease RseP (regulator of RpoE activity)